MDRVFYISAKEIKAIVGGQRFYLFPCFGIYDLLFEDAQRVTCTFVGSGHRVTVDCKVNVGYAPKHMGGYVGQKYYILRW